MILSLVVLMECIINVISLNCDGWYLDFADQTKSKKVTINPKTNNNKCFQYTVTIELDHE